MKILAIRLRNLASIEGSYEIDFTAEPLLSAGIFAISGPTGSGKSTILDALCLALFDKAPRFTATNEKITLQDVGNDRIQQNDVRNILRRGAAEGFAEVDFVAVDGFRYASRWTVYRARRKATGSLQNQQMVVRNLDSEVELQGTKTELLNQLTTLVGLTYEQFTRTVLLAQNDFATFLKSRDDAKAELLEKLTGTDIYSRISMAVYAHNKEIQASLNELMLRMGEVALLSEEEMDKLEEQRQQLSGEREKNRLLLQQIEQKIGWYETYAGLLLSREQAETSLAGATNDLQQAEPRFKLISRIDRVQDARPFVLAKKNLSGSLLSRQQQLEVNKKEFTLKTNTLQKTDEIYLTRKKTVESCLNEIRRLEPDIRQARILDVQLKDLSKNKKNAEDELQERVNAREAGEKEGLAKEKTLNDLVVDLHSLDEWINEYGKYKSLVTRADYILSLLNTANNTRQKIRKAETVLSRLNDSLRKVTDSLSEREKAYSINKEHLALCTHRLDESQNKLDGLSIDAVRTEYAEVNSKREAVQTAHQAWINLDAVKKDILQRNEKRILWEKQLAQAQELLQRKSSELELVKTERDTIFRLYENSKLALSHNVAELRGALLEGEPCPVCGSCQHPHARNDVQLNSLFQQMESEYQQARINYEKRNSEWVGITKDAEHLAVRLQENEAELAQLAMRLQEQEASWEKQAVGIVPEDSSESGVENWFNGQIRQLQERIGALTNVEKSYDAESKTYREIKKEIDLFLLREGELKDVISHTEKEKQSVLAEYEKQKVLCEQDQLQFDELFTRLGEEIPIKDWVERWSEDHDVFTKGIRDLVDLWKDKHKRKDILQLSFQKLTTELEGHRKLVSLAVENEKKARLACQSIRDTFERIKEERSSLLDGKPIDEFEKELRDKQQEAEANLNLSREELEILHSQCAGLEGQIAQDQQEIEKLKRELLSVNQALSDWLESQQIDSEEKITEAGLTELLDVDAGWVRNERHLLNRLQEAKTSFQATLKERTAQLEKHFNSLNKPDLEKETKEDLFISLSMQQQKNEEIERVFSEIVTKFVIQQQNKERLKSFEKELNEKQLIAGRWAKLTDLIGQASGEKFKIIAQGYTLNILLLHANKHLSYLSSRYELQQVQGTLALQVIDRDMCDEVRTVYSLSGGESFLVSLSLALGLSSLSSNNMRVESLFIDEGFGSLDADSLRMVMEALEQLQTQGRKVGVISHVAEMSERIVTQIVLNKGVNGKSKLTVIS